MSKLKFYDGGTWISVASEDWVSGSFLGKNGTASNADKLGSYPASDYVTNTKLNSDIETLLSNIKNTYVDIQYFNTITTAISTNFLTKDDASKTYAKNSSVGQANGIAPLDATGKIASSYLPSYVDDVLEYTNRGSFPTTGETGKIYISTSDGKTYRWSGSTYSEISASLALGETSSTAYAGDKGKANADAIAALQSNKLDKSSVVNNLTSTSTSSPLSAAQGKALNDKFANYATQDWVSNNYFNKTNLVGFSEIHTGGTAYLDREYAQNDTAVLTAGAINEIVSDLYEEFQIRGNYVTTDTTQTISGAKTFSSKITQGAPSSDATIVNMNRFEADLFVAGNGAMATNTPKVAGFYLGKSQGNDANRHMDIVSGGDYSYIDFNKASVINDYQARLLVNVTTGATEWVWGTGTKTFSFTGGTVSATSFVEGGKSLSDKYQAKGDYLTSIPKATDSALGGIKIGYTDGTVAGSSVQKGVQLDSNNKAYIEVTKKNITDALGYTPPTTNTTYSAGTGLSLSGTSFSVSYGTTAGTACQGNDSRLSNSRPASDVYSWAKASTKPTYTWSEITDKPSTFTPPTASSSTLGGIKIGYTDGTVAGSSVQKGVQLDANNKAYIEVTKKNITDIVGEASDKNNGLMSSTDKKNLDTIVNSFNSDDADTTIETVKEVLKVFESYPAGTSLTNALAGKLDKSSVSGTSGYIPKFTGANTIGNSVISQAASNKTTIGGKLVVNAGADTSSGNCDEGIRVLPASGWAELFLSNDTSTTGTGGWLIARRGSAGTTSGAVGDFTIEYGGWQGNGLTLYANGNRPRWKNNELAYKSDVPTNYLTSIPTATSSTLGGVKIVDEDLYGKTGGNGYAAGVDHSHSNYALVEHSSLNGTYGLGSTSLYGHVKIQTGDMNGTTNTNGIAAGLGHTHSNYLTSHQSLAGYATQSWVNSSFEGFYDTEVKPAIERGLGNFQNSVVDPIYDELNGKFAGYLKVNGQSNYNCNTTYDASLSLIAVGSNCPSGSQYGVLLTLPYRKATGNTSPDFGAQIYIPNGDDKTKPNSMFFRTSLSGSWNSWQEVATTSNIAKVNGSAQSSSTTIYAPTSAGATNQVLVGCGSSGTSPIWQSIKTINNQTLLGSGNISISGGSGSSGALKKVWSGVEDLTSTTIVNALWQVAGKAALLIVYLVDEDAYGFFVKQAISQDEWAFTGTAKQPGGDNFLIDAEYQDGNGTWYSTNNNPDYIEVYAIYSFE